MELESRDELCRVSDESIAAGQVPTPDTESIPVSRIQHCMTARLSLLILLALTVTGCPDRRTNPIRVSDDEVYRKRCARCHDPYPANHFTFERWDAYLKTHPEKKRHRPKSKEMMSIRYFLGI